METKITKVSDIDANKVAKYINLDSPSVDETKELERFISIAKAYISSYTNRKLERTENDPCGTYYVDDCPDLVIALLTLCQSMYDQRCLYFDKSNINPLVQSVLDMHRVSSI